MERKGMPHLTVDVYGIDAGLLLDAKMLHWFLAELPRHMGMHLAYGPVVVQIDTPSDPLDAGLSGFTIIDTSHVSFHAWPPYGMINVDAFSCNDFDEDAVVAFISRTFQTIDIERDSRRRALRSPRKARPVPSGIA